MRRVLRFLPVTAPTSCWTGLQMQARCCATVPSEEEVVRAYGVLGVSPSSPYADVKKRYVNLAKEHHPDVSASTAASNSSRMVDINQAYSVVTRFHKSGRTLSTARAGGASASGSSANRNAGRGYSWANAQQGSQQKGQYHPWHEDVDPLLYEMMWEEMRRQNEEEAFAQSMPPGGFDGFDGPWSQQYPFYAQHTQRQQWKPRSNGSGNQQTAQTARQTPVKTTTWAEPDLKALVNMYQDGKSFEFIANALGKDVATVVEEFNRWSDDSKTNSRHDRNANRRKGPRQNRRRQASFNDGPFYYTESPDDDIPFEFYEMMHGMGGDMGGEEMAGDPYGYYDDDDLFETAAPNGGAMPFTGAHYMHGSPQHTHRAQSSGSAQKRRNQGSQQQQQSRRNRKNHSSNNRNRQNQPNFGNKKK